jgi:hypothetical protein
MIQLNTTTSPFAPQAQSTNILSSANSSDSGFQSALSAALSATLKNFGIDPNQVTLSIASATTAAAAIPTSATTAPVQNPVVSTSPTTGSGSGSTSSAGNSTQSADDAYWAAQPPAVQALRGIEDFDKRSAMAAQLSAKGFSIDVPIMVWGWDPAKITAARQSYGYTWVPSANQAAITEAPGIKLPSLADYDPTKAPAGSIMV